MGASANSGKDTGKPYRVRGEFYPSPKQFDGCFTTFYHFALDVDDGASVTDFLQPEWANIRFFAGDAPTATIGETQIAGPRFVATGPSSLPCRFDLSTTRMWGIGLLPIGWARFVDADAYDLSNTIWDGAKHPAFAKFDVLTQRLADPALSHEDQLAHIIEVLSAIMRPNRDEPKIRRVHQALVEGTHGTVSALAAHCGMSMRTLERVCQRYFGFSPKLLMRRQRFMRSLTSFMLHQARGDGQRWTESMDEDYHDQAQFTREFREFMTMLPSEYASLDHPILSAFMEARARIWGTAAQTLDRPAG